MRTLSRLTPPDRAWDAGCVPGASTNFGSEVDDARERPRRLGVFASWRLQAYGYTLAAGYALFAFYLFHLSLWPLGKLGLPVYTDFTDTWVVGSLALHGNAAAIYDPVKYVKAQEAVVGAGHVLFSNWPYPPTYFLILAPLALMPYLPAFFAWGAATLGGYATVVYLIARRREAIALALASPFAAWNFIAGQGGALTAALMGAALLALERRPVLAGALIGCLTYKPQWGILIPVALVAAGAWRAIASAAVTTVLLAGLSLAVFGIGPWMAFPHVLLAQADVTVFSTGRWGLLQSVYGLTRYLNGADKVAWLGQTVTTLAAAAAVWLVWRSHARHALKAAALSAAALLATPYAFAYDLAAIAVPIAFLAKDQIECGLLRGEQTALLAMFGAGFCAFVTAGKIPVGVPIALALLYLILRRSCVAQSLSVKVFPRRILPPAIDFTDG